MIVAVAGRLRRDGRGVVGGNSAALTGCDVPLSGRNHLLSAGSAHAVLPYRVNQRRADDRAAHRTDLGLRAGGRAGRSVGQLGRQLNTAPPAGLGRGAGGLGAGVVTQRLSHHLAALGANLRLGTGSGRGGHVLVAAGQRQRQQKQRRCQTYDLFHGTLPFSWGSVSITLCDDYRQ